MPPKFRTPPKIKTPASSRWECVFRLPDKIEIWFLGLRNAYSGYYPIYCKLNGDLPMATYSVPEAVDLGADQRIIKNWGNRFFWSQKDKTFVVQLLQTFEYSERLETEQLFLSGADFVIQKTLKNENLQILPNKDFVEVYPEMHPDRSRRE